MDRAGIAGGICPILSSGRSGRRKTEEPCRGGFFGNTIMERYKYYVYISHARKDGGKAAVFLRHHIENFRVPAQFVEPEYLPEDPSFPGPVFCDLRGRESSEYAAGEEVLEALASSRYLLVICSPAAVKSLWVHKEIEYFLASHGNDYSKIVPVILEGRPGSGGEEECLPPLLRTHAVTSRDLPTMIPDEDEPRREGWENGLVQVLGYMLNLDRQKITAAIERKKFRRMRLCADIGILVALGFVALAVRTIPIGRTTAEKEQLALAGKTQALESAEKARREQARAEQSAELARKNELEARQDALLAIAKEKEAGARKIRAEKGEREAGLQAEIAQRSLDFMRSVFISADPARKEDNDLKLLETIRTKLPEIPKLTPWQLRASVSVSTAIVLGNLGEYDSALRLGREALALHETHDPRDPEAAVACSCIGSVCARQGKFAEALKFHEKALAIRLARLGASHPDTIRSYCAVASVHEAQGRFDEALKFYRKALEISVRERGEAHPETARICGGIAAVYASRSKFAEALKFHEKALAIRLKTVGKHHPDTVASYCAVAAVYADQGKFEKALELYKTALEIALKMPEYFRPEAAKIYNNIATVYATRGEFGEALKFHKKVLEIRIPLLGERHSDTAKSYNSIALVYSRQGKFAEALKFYERALGIWLEKSGELDPDTAKIYNNIAAVLAAQGRFDDALRFHRKALKIRSQVLGELHPDTVTSYNNIASVYAAQGKFAEALTFHRKALEISRKTLGENHPATAAICNDIALVYSKQNKTDEALKYHKKALAIRVGKFGTFHQDTAASCNNIAVILWKMGKRSEALASMEKAVSIVRKVLPPTHPQIKLYENNLAEMKEQAAVPEETADR